MELWHPLIQWFVCWCCCAVSIFIKRLICQNKPQMCPWPSANKLRSFNKFKCDAIWCGFHEYLFFMGMIIVMVDVCVCMCICVAAVSIMTESSLNLGKLRWAANKEKYSCKSSRQHQKPLTIKSSLFLFEDANRISIFCSTLYSTNETNFPSLFPSPYDWWPPPSPQIKTVCSN